MSDYREQSNAAKAARKGITEQRSHIKSKVKHEKPFHVTCSAPRWIGRIKVWAKCRTENEAKAVVAKMERTLPDWGWKYKDVRTGEAHGQAE